MFQLGNYSEVMRTAAFISANVEVLSLALIQCRSVGNITSLVGRLEEFNLRESLRRSLKSLAEVVREVADEAGAPRGIQWEGRPGSTCNSLI